MSRNKQEALLLEERIEKIRKKNEEIKRRHLVRLSCIPVVVNKEISVHHSALRLQGVGQVRKHQNLKVCRNTIQLRTHSGSCIYSLRYMQGGP